MSDTTASPAPHRDQRWRGLFAPALYLALVAMQFVDLRDGVHGHPELYSFFLLGFGALTLVCLPWLLRLRTWTRDGRIVLLGGVLLFGWALLSASHSMLPRLFEPAGKVTRIYLVVPLLTAVVTMLGAWGLAAALPRWNRREVLWRAAMLVTLTTLVAGPRTMLAKHSVRLGTGMGGAATYHVVLLLCLGILLSSALTRHHRWASWGGTLLCLLGILLTGSRAGLACLVVFVGLTALLLGMRGQAKVVAPLVAGLAALLGLVLAFVPMARRLLQAGDAGRQQNLETALRVWQASPHDMVLGIGSGRMWPWYAFETGHLTIPWKGLIRTGFGRGTTNPHSVVLGVLVELGLVGLALLAVVLLPLLVRLVLRWRGLAGDRTVLGAAELLPLVAVVATLPAFLLDFYLFKNYAISFWWWLVVAIVVGVRQDRPVTAARPEGKEVVA